MELKEIIMLIVGLGISGLITYKTFQWAMYEEIGVGLTSLFLGFAIFVFLAVTNYEVISSWRLLDPAAEVNILTEKINAATENSINLINTELERQKEFIRPVTQALRQVADVRNDSAEQANKMAQRALEIAREAKEESERLGSVQAWATWDSVMGEFLEIETYLERWEEKNAFKRDVPAAQSITELERRLEALRESVDLPATIRALYLKRHRKYEILMTLKETFEPYAGQFVRFDLSMPAPQKLPSGKALSSEPEEPGAQ